MVEERTHRHGQPVTESFFPQATYHAIRANGRSKRRGVRHDAEGQPCDGRRPDRIHRGRGTNLQRIVDVTIVRQFGASLNGVRFAADQVSRPSVCDHHCRLAYCVLHSLHRRRATFVNMYSHTFLERQLCAYRQPTRKSLRARIINKIITRVISMRRNYLFFFNTEL